MVIKVFIVISSLILHLGARAVKDKTNKSSTNTSDKNGEGKNIHTSMSPTTEQDEEENGHGVEKRERFTTLHTSKTMTTSKAIPSLSSPTEEDNKHTNRKDYSYTESGKIDLTLAIALILVAFCVGAVVMAVILCCTQEKWTSRIPSQRTHHASKTSTERSDAVLVMSDVQRQTSGSVDVNPNYNEILSTNIVPVNLVDEYLELRGPSEPNEYEIVSEHGNRRSSLEHLYGCLSAVGDVDPIAHNEMEHNQTINNKAQQDYFVLLLDEADGKNVTEGSEMEKGEENHDYFVLAPHERDRENLTEGNKMEKGEKTQDYFVLAPHERDRENLTEENKLEKGEENHDYFVLVPHERDGEMPLKKIN